MGFADQQVPSRCPTFSPSQLLGGAHFLVALASYTMQSILPWDRHMGDCGLLPTITLGNSCLRIANDTGDSSLQLHRNMRGSDLQISTTGGRNLQLSSTGGSKLWISDSEDSGLQLLVGPLPNN